MRSRYVFPYTPRAVAKERQMKRLPPPKKKEQTLEKFFEDERREGFLRSKDSAKFR